MVTAKDVRKIHAYNFAVLDAYARKLERLPWSVVSKDRGATWHSMAGVFHHITRVYDGWLNYTVQGRSADESMRGRRWDSLTSMEEVRASLAKVRSGIEPFLEGLTDAELRRKVKAEWQPKACSLADAFGQVTLEQAHHLGEIIAMLWQEDIEPPEMTWLATNWALQAKRAKRRARKRAR